MPSITYTHTTKTTSTDTVRNRNLRLSFFIQNPKTGNTVYRVDNSSQTTSDGIEFGAGDIYKMNWRDDGLEPTNQAQRFITSSSTNDLKVVEVLANSLEEFKRITKTEG